MHYYGTRLSENISRREPEGYLPCLNVPVARTGTQDYLPEELGLPPGSSFIPVLRPEAEVFSPETIASFEGMPVTNDHPPEGVDTSNIRALQKGLEEAGVLIHFDDRDIPKEFFDKKEDEDRI